MILCVFSFFSYPYICIWHRTYLEKGSPSRPTFRSRPTLRSPNPSSVRIAVAQRRDVSPNRDPDAAAAAMEAQRPVAKGQPADAATMEGQAPDATVMEDQPPDAMAGPSLPLAVAAEGQPRVPEMTWPRRTPEACPRRSLKGWQRPLTTWSCLRAPWMAKLHRRPLLCPEILAKNPGGGGEPGSPGCKDGDGQPACLQGRRRPGSLPRQQSRPSSTDIGTTGTEEAVSANTCIKIKKKENTHNVMKIKSPTFSGLFLRSQRLEF